MKQDEAAAKQEIGEEEVQELNRRQVRGSPSSSHK